MSSFLRRRTFKVLRSTYSSVAAASMADLKVSQEVEQLVDRLCTLNLIETSQVVRILKERLNLPDIVTAAPSAASHAQPAVAAAQAAPAVEAKTEFKVTLDKFDPASKAKVIREIKALLPNLNLVEAKAFVEGAPKVIKEKVKKEEADKIKTTLEALGATIVLD